MKAGKLEGLKYKCNKQSHQGKEAGASKLRMPQIQGFVAKGSEVEVEDAMVRFGGLRESGPGASWLVEIREGRIEGSRWPFRGGLKDPVKVKLTFSGGNVLHCSRSHRNQ